MALPVRESSNTYNGESPSVALTGGLSDAIVIAIIKGDASVTRTLDAVTLDGAAADFIQNLSFDSGRAISGGVCYWLNAKHPGAGSFTLATTWIGGINNVQMEVLEYSAVDQSTPISTIVTNSFADTADGSTVSVTLTGQSGNLALSWAAIADNTAASVSGSLVPSSNLVSLTGPDVFAGLSRIGVGEDAVVATASEVYDWTISQDGSVTIDSTVLGSFAIFGSAVGVVSSLLLINRSIANYGGIRQ